MFLTTGPASCSRRSRPCPRRSPEMMCITQIEGGNTLLRSWNLYRVRRGKQRSLHQLREVSTGPMGSHCETIVSPGHQDLAIRDRKKQIRKIQDRKTIWSERRHPGARQAGLPQVAAMWSSSSSRGRHPMQLQRGPDLQLSSGLAWLGPITRSEAEPRQRWVLPNLLQSPPR